MPKVSKFIVSLLTAVALVIGSVLLFNVVRDKPDTGVAPAPVNTQFEPGQSGGGGSLPKSSTMRSDKKVVTVQPQTSSNRNVSAQLQMELHGARDLRTFALSAQGRPREGGYFYATYAINLCGMDVPGLVRHAKQLVEEEVRASSTISSERLAAIEAFSSRCTSFADGEVRQMLDALKAKSTDGADPLVNAHRAIDDAFKSKDTDRIRTAAAKLLAMGDPLLAGEGEMFRRIMWSNPAAKTKGLGAYWFEGQIYSSEDDRVLSEFSLALQLGQCKESAPCQLDEQIQLSCITGGDCKTDRQGYVLAQYRQLGDGEAGFSRVLAIANRIRAALEAGTAESFLQ